MPKVTIYSTPTCPFCKMEKSYLQEKRVDFEEIDVSRDHEAAQAMIEKSGQMGVPVTVVEHEGQEHVIVGFDQSALDKAIGIH